MFLMVLLRYPVGGFPVRSELALLAGA